ncbi:MAG: DUF11 domain-containing protein [Chloroflexi bacterium]|nr:DUF11 domain-containing protein [Chloroflexota bacterium]
MYRLSPGQLTTLRRYLHLLVVFQLLLMPLLTAPLASASSTGAPATETIEQPPAGGAAQRAPAPDVAPPAEPALAAAPPVTETVAVSISDGGLSPAEATVVAGGTVVWTNQASAPHSVTSDGGLFDSGKISPGGTFTFTFPVPGEYPYRSLANPSLAGTVKVVRPARAGVAVGPGDVDAYVEKSADTSLAIAGGFLTYTIMYGNRGTATAAYVTVKDTLPPGLVFRSSRPTPYYPGSGAYMTSYTSTEYIWNVGVVPAGVTGTIQLVTQISPTIESGTVLTNVVRIEHGDPDANPGDNVSTNTVTALSVPGPDVWVQKYVSAPLSTSPSGSYPSSVRAGGLITYVVQYGNSGNLPALNVLLTDTRPVSTTLFDASTPPTQTGNSLIWDIGNLGAHQSRAVTLTLQVDPSLSMSRSLLNVVTIGMDGADPTPWTNVAQVSASAVPAQPDLNVYKNRLYVPVAPGGTALYTVTVGNPASWSGADAPSVRLTETLPISTTLVAYGAADGLPITPTTPLTASVVAWDLGAIAIGGRRDITLAVQLDPNLMPGAWVNNRIDVTPLGQVDLSSWDNYSYSGFYAGYVNPDLRVEKYRGAANPDLYAGRPVTYYIQLYNDGASPATGVRVTDTLPISTTFVGATPPPVVTGTQVIWDLGSLAGFGRTSITVTLDVDPAALNGATAVNAVAAGMDQVDPTSGNNYSYNYATILNYAANLLVTKNTRPECYYGCTVVAGSLLTYVINYTNRGPVMATGVRITDTLPFSTTLVQAFPAPITQTGNVLVWEAGALPANPNQQSGGYGHINVIVRVDPNAPINQYLENRAAIGGDQPDPYPYDNTSYLTSQVVPYAPDLTVNKYVVEGNYWYFDSKYVYQGRPVTFTIEYRNQGPAPATGVLITETLPVSTTLLSTSVPTTTQTGNRLVWSVGSLPGNSASGFITLVLLVDANAPVYQWPSYQSLSNRVDVGGNEAETSTSNNFRTFTLYVQVYQPDLYLNESPSSGVYQGRPMTLTIWYGNQGAAPATGVRVTQTLPVSTTFVSASVTPVLTPTAPSDNQVVWYVGDVPGYTYGNRITLTLLVDPNAALNWGQQYRVDVAGDQPESQTWNNYYISYLYVQAYVPDLYVNKYVNYSGEYSANVLQARPVTFTIMYQNLAAVPATGVRITETLPISTTFLWTSAPTATQTVTQVVWSIGDLPGNSSPGYITLVLLVDPNAPVFNTTSRSLTNRVDIGGDQPESTTYNNTDTFVLYVQENRPDLYVNKWAPFGSTVYQGQTVTFTIEYRNSGAAPATGVRITDTLPVSTTFVSASVTPTVQTDGQVAWSIGSLPGNSNYTYITLVLRVDQDAPLYASPLWQRLTNRVDIGGDLAETNTANNSDTSDVSVYEYKPDLYASKYTSPYVYNVSPGQLITYQIQYRNQGAAPATGVRLTDTLPVSTTFVSASVTPTAVTDNQVVWTVGDLPGNSSYRYLNVTLRLDPDARQGQYVTNRVDVGANEPDANPNTNWSTNQVWVPQSSIWVSKTVNRSYPYYVQPGTLVSFTVQYWNYGGAPAAGFTVTDTMPSRMSFVSAVPAPTSQAAGQAVWNLGALGAGAGGLITVTALVADDAPLDVALYNQAQINTTGSDSGSYSHSASAYVYPHLFRANLFVSKTVYRTQVPAGLPVTYTVRVANNQSSSLADAANVRLTDTIPTGMSFVSAEASVPITVVQNVTGTAAFDVGAIPIGAERWITLTMRVNPDATPGWYLQNYVQAQPIGQVDDYTGDNQYWASSIYVQAPEPDLRIEKSASTYYVAPGDLVTYRLAYRNQGGTQATGVRITDTLAPWTMFESASVTPTMALTDRVAFDVGLLAIDQSGEIWIVVRVDPNAPNHTDLTNRADIGMDLADPAPGNNSAWAAIRTRIPTPDLGVTKQAPVASAFAGSTVQYHVGVYNSGGLDAASVRLTDTLPAGTTLFSAAANGPITPTESTGAAAWDLGPLAVGASRQITVVLRIDPSLAYLTRLTNTVQVQPLGQVDENQFNNVAVHSAVLVLEPLTPGRALPFSDDVESGPNGWTPTGFWHVITDAQTLRVISDINPSLVTLPDDGALPAAFSGRASWWYGQDSTGTFCGDDFRSIGQSSKNGCTSKAANAGDLISPAFDFAGLVSATLHFKTWWEIEGVDTDRFDMMEVYASTDGGVLWNHVGKLNPLNDPNGSHWQAYSDNGLGRVGSWQDAVFDLSRYAGIRNVRVKLHFATRDALYNGFRGWFVDDVSLQSGGYVIPFTVASLDPTTVAQGSNAILYVHGTGFQVGPSFKVTVGGANATAVVLNASTIQYYLPAGVGVGAHAVVVTNGTGDVLTAGTLTVTGVPAPNLISIDPTIGTTNAPHTLTLSGASFQSGIRVWLGETELGNVQFISSTRVAATVPAGVEPRRYNVVVRNPDGQSDTLVLAYEAIGVVDTWVAKASNPTQVLAGDPVTYTIRYGNAGDVTATNVRLTDTLPVSFTLTSVLGPAPAETAGSLRVWSWPSLAPHVSGTITLLGQVDPAAPGGLTIANGVEIGQAEPDATPGNNATSAQTTVQYAVDLQVEKWVVGSFTEVLPGTVFTYAIQFRNNSPTNAARGVVISDVLSLRHGPFAWEQVSGHPVLAPTIDGQLVTWAISGTLPPLAGGLIYLGVRDDGNVDRATWMTNTVRISSADADTAPENNAAHATMLVSPPDRYPPTVQVFSPRSGAVWFSGGRYRIRWHAEDAESGVPMTHSISLKLSLDGGATWTAITPDPVDNTGVFEWSIPSGLASERAVVRVEAVDGLGNLGSADSGEFRIRPVDPQAIQNLRTSNVTDVSATLSFLTRHPALAWVTYWISGTEPLSATVAHDFRADPGQTHWLRIGGSDPLNRLLPSTPYRYRIFLDEAMDWSFEGTFQTGPTLDERTSHGAFGQVLDEHGRTVGGAIVYVTLEHTVVVTDGTPAVNPQSSLLSAVTNESGFWWVDLAGARTPDHQAAFFFEPGDPVHLDVESDRAGTGDLYRVGHGDTTARSPWPEPFVLTVRPLYERTIPLGYGWNAVNLPLVPERPLRVSQLARAANEGAANRLVAVFRYDRTRGLWEGGQISGTAPLGFDFELRPGEGYFFQMREPGELPLLGHVLTSPAPLPMVNGWNLVGIPNWHPNSVPHPANLDAGRVVAQTDVYSPTVGTTIHNVREIVRWVYGAYEGYVAGYPFNNFAIRDNQAYFIRALRGGTYTPNWSDGSGWAE